MPLTPEQRRLIGRIGAAARAGEDGRRRTQAAREAADRKFYEQTDPALSEEERWRLANVLRRQHLDRMRLASVTKAKHAREMAEAARNAERDFQQAQSTERE